MNLPAVFCKFESFSRSDEQDDHCCIEGETSKQLDDNSKNKYNQFGNWKKDNRFWSQNQLHKQTGGNCQNVQNHQNKFNGSNFARDIENSMRKPNCDEAIQSKK